MNGDDTPPPPIPGLNITYYENGLPRVDPELAGPLRLELTGPYDGQHHGNFIDFSFRLKAYMTLVDYDFLPYMNEAEMSETTLPELETTDADGVPLYEPCRCMRLSVVLHTTLLQLCTGPAREIVARLHNMNGFEAWRQFCVHAIGTARPGGVNTLRLIRELQTPGPYAIQTFISHFRQWLSQLEQFEMSTGRPLHNYIKLAILLPSTH